MGTRVRTDYMREYMRKYRNDPKRKEELKQKRHEYYIQKKLKSLRESV